MRETLYRYRYLLLGIILAVIVGQITFEYSRVTSHIDLSSGGIADWPQYGRNQEGTRYTALNQINRDNVAYLRKAWEYHTGDFSDGSDGRPETTFQATPILVDGVLYLATVYGRVIALNPDGDLILARLTREGYREQSRTHLIDPTPNTPIWAHPAYAGNCVYARSDQELKCAVLAD